MMLILRIMSMDHSGASENAQRRKSPRIFDTDWMVLRQMRSDIAAALAPLAKKAGSALVDFGCGSQPYRDLIEAQGLSYSGADLGISADIEIAASGHVSAPDACADIISSFQVLEHVRDLDLYLAEAHRMLRPGGHLLLSTHGNWLYHPHPEDHRRWTRTGLILDIETRGFAVQSCVPIVGPLAWTTLMRLTSFAFVLRKIPVLGTLLAAMLASAMNLRAMIEDAVTPAAVRVDNACVYLVVAQRV
jgi:SAM-dependent methyltransferase